jgi:PPOX class probable F420-dependent enzyme
MVEIPDSVRRMLEAKNFWQFVTINEDGSASATPVFADVDGGHVLVNTAKGRLKERNVRRDPRVVLAMIDREDPYRWAEIKGRVVEFVEGREADDVMDRLGKKYLDLEKHPGQPGEQRVLLRIEPTKVNVKIEMGSEILRAKLDSSA